MVSYENTFLHYSSPFFASYFSKEFMMRRDIEEY